MTTPDKSSAKSPLEHERRFPSRIRLFLESAALSSVAAVCFAIITTLLFHQGKATGEDYIQSVVDDLVGMFVLLPIGLLLPTSWLLWAGCVVVVVTRKRAWLGLVVVGAILFAVGWHRQFLAIMSV